MSYKKLLPDTIRKHKGKSFVGVSTSFICYDNSSRIFMAKRSENARDEQNRWDFGAGGLKHGQTIEQNMRRELMEEYGAEPLRITSLGYFELFRTLTDGTLTHWIIIPHAVQVDPNNIKIMEPTMFNDSGWFTLDNLPSPLHSAIESSFLPQFGDKLRAIIQN